MGIESIGKLVPVAQAQHESREDARIKIDHVVWLCKVAGGAGMLIKCSCDMKCINVHSIRP